MKLTRKTMARPMPAWYGRLTANRSPNPLCRLGIHDGALSGSCVDCGIPEPTHPDRIDPDRLPHPQEPT